MTRNELIQHTNKIVLTKISAMRHIKGTNKNDKSEAAAQMVSEICSARIELSSYYRKRASRG